MGAGRRPGRDRGQRLASAAERAAILEDWRTSLFFGWDEIEVASTEPGLEETLGLTVEAVADAWSMDPNEAALDLIARSDNRVQMVAYGRSEDDLRAVLGHELTSIGSDGLAMDPGRAVERRPPASAVVRMLSAVPGTLRPRGGSACPSNGPSRWRPRLRPIGPALPTAAGSAEGAVADLVVFDPATIVDGATFQEPNATARPGSTTCIVAGRPVVADGRQLDDSRPGRVLLA